tara:strand:+ start:131 stop:919 length:789 start_codon:yes stop_codon:yes gene_type:complete
MLRLNSQQRLVASMAPELLSYCSHDAETDFFTVPTLARLLSYRLILCTCAATHLLIEAGVPSLSARLQKAPRLPLEERAHADHGLYGGLSDAGSVCPGIAPGSTPDIIAGAITNGLGTAALGVEAHFTHVFNDEASQALEPEILMPLSLAGRWTNVMMSGDHKQVSLSLPILPICHIPFFFHITRFFFCDFLNQLGPVVRSRSCREHGLARSLLERLLELPFYGDEAPSASAPFSKLVRNYRSHGSLLELPSRLFYGNPLPL